MAYGAVHVAFFDHAKYLAALARDPRAPLLYLWGLAYCNDQLTDGQIPAIQVQRRVELKKPVALAAVLVDVGLWEQTDGGYLVHDFLAYNETAERIREKRALAAKRQDEWRNKTRDEQTGRYASNGTRNALRNASGHARGNASSHTDTLYANTLTSANAEDQRPPDPDLPIRRNGSSPDPPVDLRSRAREEQAGLNGKGPSGERAKGRPATPSAADSAQRIGDANAQRRIDAGCGQPADYERLGIPVPERSASP